MRFPKLVKERRAGGPVISMQDAIVAHAWGLKLDEWLALTDFQRKKRREDVVFAPNYREGHE